MTARDAVDAAGIRERPILFSAPMVRAILDGGKTQTRRVVKKMHVPALGRPPADGAPWYAEPGDRLWVRETYALHHAWDGHPPTAGGSASKRVWHRADAPNAIDGRGRWRPSIHMPRWASRITLEVTSVRVERLQDITEEDARAEGVDWSRPEPYGEKWDDDDREDPREVGYPPAGASFARDNFRRLWSGINGPESWDANPWVWVVGFRLVDPTGHPTLNVNE